MRASTLGRLAWLVAFSALLVWSTTGRAATLLHYDFSNGSGTAATDLSGAGNDGILTGFVDTAAGAGAFGASEGWVTDGGLSFLDDSVRSFVETPLALSALYDSGAGQNKNFTIEYLSNYSGAASWTPAIGSNQDPFNGTDTFFLGIHDNQANNEVRMPGGDGGTIGAIPWSAPDTDIHHIAMTFDAATETVGLFVDGVATGFGARAGTNMNSSALFRIGNTGWADGEQWGGVMYGAAISDELLVPADFVLPFTPVEPNPPVGTLLHYDFTANGGTTVTDLSGQGNDGTLVGFADTSAGAGQFGASEGWVDGGGLSFLDDADRSYVETPLPLNALENKDFTVEYTANYSGAEDWTPAIASDDLPIFFFGIDSGQTGNEVNVPGGGGGTIGTQPWTAPDPTEHHLAVTYERETGELEVFVDGVPMGTSSRGASMTTENLFRIANSGWAEGEQWAGVITGIAISDMKLGPSDFVLAPIPEPATLTLLLLGCLAGLGGWRCRRR